MSGVRSFLRPGAPTGGGGSPETNACAGCCSFHAAEAACPGEPEATGPEKRTWRVLVDTPSSVEAYSVLIAACGELSRARILTEPNILWLAPGLERTLKFYGSSVELAEKKAVEFVDRHCVARGYLRRDGLEPVDIATSAPERERAAPGPSVHREVPPRKPHVAFVRYGPTHPIAPGQTVNVSASGMFVGTAWPLAPGMPVNIRMESSPRLLTLSGEVVWNRLVPEPGRPLGMGIKLVDPPPRYKAFVRSLP